MNASTAISMEKESVVAVLPSRGSSDEAQLSRSVSVIELEASAIVVANDDDYRGAAEFGRKLKQASAEVVAFFKPMKDAAHKSHAAICEREKLMLAPLVSAEHSLKITMGDYAAKKERERRAEEAEAQRIAKEESERKLAEALEHEQSGDSLGAEYALADAQMADSISRNLSVQAGTPKADGVGVSKDWTITTIDDAEVPITLNGIMLRPVNEQAVIRLIRASKGTVQIPGVRYQEISKISIRK